MAVIAGPTASGKSAVALAVAAACDGVIINADASQLYADLRVLTARPSPADEAVVPHRLYGVLDGADIASAAAWAALARAEITAALAAGRLPILVGGTGLYLRTLIEGIAPVPAIDAAVREAVRGLSAAGAQAALVAEDPAAAARLAPADQQRIRRALEVVRSSGRTLADWQQHRSGGLALPVMGFVLNVPRNVLHARCNARFEAMLAAGALDEVSALLARRLAGDRPILKAVGVPPLAAHLAGHISLADAAAQACLDTRHYAKRQTTWFRNQHPGWTAIDARDGAAAVIERLNR